MTKFQNLSTGLVWQVDDPDLIRRLEKDGEFAEVREKSGHRKADSHE